MKKYYFIIICFALITTYVAKPKEVPFSLSLSNMEALAEGGDIIREPIDCLWNYDTPAWFVDDEYKVVCRDAKTGENCVQVKGHNFKNTGRCIPASKVL